MAARQLLSPTRIGFFGILLRDSFYFDAIVIIIFLDFSTFLSKGFCQHSPDVIRNLQRFPPPPPPPPPPHLSLRDFSRFE